MPIRSPVTTFATHEVLNQPPALEDFDAYALDNPLIDAVAASDAGRLEGLFAALRSLAGDDRSTEGLLFDGHRVAEVVQGDTHRALDTIAQLRTKRLAPLHRRHQHQVLRPAPWRMRSIRSTG